MSGHTPGPWNIDSHRRRGGDQVIDQIISSSEWEICSVARDAGEADGQDESEANARLIAAAPELLGAAKLTGLCFKRANLDENSFLGDDEHEAWTALNAAIAKAEPQ